MKLADRHGRPVTEVLSEYPEAELPFWSVWMAREPTDGQRVELIVAQLLANFIAAHSKKGARTPKPHELMLSDWWADQNRKRAAREDLSELVGIFTESGINVHFK